MRISQNRKWADQRFITILVDKKLGETTDLCVEIMNSKRQVTGKLSHAVQIRVCRLTKTGSLTSLISAWAERSLTLRYHGNKIPAKFPDLNTFFWKRRPFALSNDESKVWATVLECKDSQESHTCQFFSFFSRHICRTIVF